MSQLTKEMFLKEVAGHQMQVLRDDGVNRHIRFKKPGTFNMQFDLITWSGHLCYTGDMGTYVFRRLEDMFEFFRDRPRGSGEAPSELRINRGYWSEKVLAADRHGKVKEFSAEKFRTSLTEDLEQWIESYVDDVTEAQELRQRFQDEVVAAIDDGEHTAYVAARDFCDDDGATVFDTMEFNAEDWTHHYTWCCRALAWGIKQYDDAKAAAAQVAPA